MNERQLPAKRMSILFAQPLFQGNNNMASFDKSNGHFQKTRTASY